MKMKPAFKDNLWGGTRLVEEYGKTTDMRPVAESWEISCHPDGPSRIANGPFAGRNLMEVLEENPGMLGEKGQGWDEFPILVKLIDAKDNLSLQVHPGDEYAKQVEGQLGKNEMWYVLDSAEGAELILGFREPVFREEMAARIRDNTILDVVHAVPVQPGDCFVIPAGMLHAIGGGVLIAEIQQSSNVTYRVYDYDRSDAGGNPRPLHIEKALDVTDTALQGQRVETPAGMVAGGFTGRVLADWEYFTTLELDVDGKAQLQVDRDSFSCLLALSGDMMLESGGEKMPLAKGESVFLPAGLGGVALEGRGKLLLTHM